MERSDIGKTDRGAVEKMRSRKFFLSIFRKSALIGYVKFTTPSVSDFFKKGQKFDFF